MQYRAQGNAKFEFLSLSFGVIRQQRQLVQPLLQLRGRFRYRRAGGGPLAGLAPAGDGFFDEPGLRVMLREELRLAVNKLAEIDVLDDRGLAQPRFAQAAGEALVLAAGRLAIDVQPEPVLATEFAGIGSVL